MREAEKVQKRRKQREESRKTGPELDIKKQEKRKKSKKGRRFYGCEDNPNCDFMSWARPVAKPCPECGSYMVRKGSKLVCANEECRHVETADKDEA